MQRSQSRLPDQISRGQGRWVRHRNCTRWLAFGRSWLPVPLAVLFAGGGSLLPVRPHHLGDERVALLSNKNPSHFTWTQWGHLRVPWLLSVENEGNEHFAAVFFDKSWSARLHICKNRYRFARVRSHSSRALCVPVCGRTMWAVGVPSARMKCGSLNSWGYNLALERPDFHWVFSGETGL